MGGCLWVSGWFSPDTSGGKAVIAIAFGLAFGWFSPDTSGGKAVIALRLVDGSLQIHQGAVIAIWLVGGFPQIHQEGKLSLPLGKWVVFP